MLSSGASIHARLPVALDKIAAPVSIRPGARERSSPSLPTGFAPGGARGSGDTPRFVRSWGCNTAKINGMM